jgi:predicted metal-dependent RNase
MKALAAVTLALATWGLHAILRWLAGAGTPRKVFVTHGEPKTANAFAALLRQRRPWDTVVPSYGDTLELL